VNVLHYAIQQENRALVWRLLELKPELIVSSNVRISWIVALVGQTPRTHLTPFPDSPDTKCPAIALAGGFDSDFSLGRGSRFNPHTFSWQREKNQRFQGVCCEGEALPNWTKEQENFHVHMLHTPQGLDLKVFENSPVSTNTQILLMSSSMLILFAMSGFFFS